MEEGFSTQYKIKCWGVLFLIASNNHFNSDHENCMNSMIIQGWSLNDTIVIYDNDEVLLKLTWNSLNQSHTAMENCMNNKIGAITVLY